MHQHVKNVPGKLMKIPLNPSLKILTPRREIKTLQDIDPRLTHSKACPCPFSTMDILLPPQLYRSPGNMWPGKQ